MEKVKTVKEGVARLLTIRDLPVPEFEVLDAKPGDNYSTLMLEGCTIPVFHWRYDPRMNAMRNYGQKAVSENCCLNSYSFVGRDVELSTLIFRELDISEYLLGSPIVNVTAFINGDACNLIAKTAAGTLANLELGATMAEGTIPQFSHRLITKHGMASDRTVNNMVEQSGVYVFAGDDPRAREYSEGEYYLYGLSEQESHMATFIQDVIKGKLKADVLASTAAHLERALAAVYRSAELGESVDVNDGGAK